MSINAEQFLQIAYETRYSFPSIHWAEPSRPLFDAASVLQKAGFADVHKGTIRHLKGCPTEVVKVRVSGKVGYPFRRFIDLEGFRWVLAKARHRDIPADPDDEWSEGKSAEERSAQVTDLMMQLYKITSSGFLDHYSDLMRTVPTEEEAAICQSWIQAHEAVRGKPMRGGLFSEEGALSFNLFSKAGFAEEVLKGGPKHALRSLWTTPG